MKKNTYLTEIETTYKTIDGSFDKTLKACKNSKDKKMVIASRDAARDAFWIAVDSNLVDNSVFVKKLHKDLNSANQRLEMSLKKLDDVSELINVMEETVRLAASPARLCA